MSFLSRRISNIFNFWLPESDSEEEHTPPITRSRKRKADEDLHRPSKYRRASSASYRRPVFRREDYEDADPWEEPAAVERRTSRAGMFGGVGTYVERDADGEEEEEDEITAEAQRRASGYSLVKKPRKLAKKSTSAKPVSPERVREGRVTHFVKKMKGFLDGVDDEAREILNEAEEIDLDRVTRELGHAKEDLEHVRMDLRHARKDVDGVEAQIAREAADRRRNAGRRLRRDEYDSDTESRTLVEEEWDTVPNERARKFVRKYGDNALHEIRVELQEPEYAIRDAEVRDMMWQVMDKMDDFARNFFAFELRRDKKKLTKAFEKMDPTTVKIIGCVASGGPGGQDGWRELFWDEEKRMALVRAIIGNVLVEQVFQHACFGGDEAILQSLASKQRELAEEDGKSLSSKTPVLSNSPTNSESRLQTQRSIRRPPPALPPPLWHHSQPPAKFHPPCKIHRSKHIHAPPPHPLPPPHHHNPFPHYPRPLRIPLRHRRHRRPTLIANAP